MKQQEILQSIQTQLQILDRDNSKEAISFYNDLISEMPYHEEITSFTIGHDTGKTQMESNLTIIIFDTQSFNIIKTTNAYLEQKLNQGHDNTEYTWLDDSILIIAFDF